MSKVVNTILIGIFAFVCLSTTCFGNEFFDTQKHYFAVFTSGFAVLWCLHQLFYTPKPTRITSLDVAITVIIAYFIVSCLSVSHYSISYLPCMLLLCCLIIWMVGRGLSQKQDFIAIAICIIFLSGILQTSWGMLQQIGIAVQSHTFKVTGGFKNSGIYGNYLAVLLPLSLSIVLQQKEKRKKTLFIVGVLLFVTCLLILPLTMARTAWIGAIAGTVVVTEYRYKWLAKIFTGTKRSILLVATATIIFVAAGIAMYHLKPESVQGRLLIYKVAASIFYDNPFIGTGFHSFANEYNLRQATYFALGNRSESEQWLAGCNQVAFNDYLQVAAETGVLGLLMMLSIGGILIYNRKAMRTLYAQGAMGVLTSLACCACFSYPFHEISIVALSGLMLLIINREIKPITWINSVWLQRATIVVTLLASGILCFRSTLELQTVYRWKDVVSKNSALGFDTTQVEYAKLHPRLENNPYFLYNYGVELLLAQKYNQSILLLSQANRYFMDTDIACYLGDAYKGVNQYDEAEKAYTLATNMAPNKFYPLYCLAKLYHKIGNEIKAIDMANIIIHKKEKVPSFITYKIKAEMQQVIDSLSVNYSEPLNRVD